MSLPLSVIEHHPYPKYLIPIGFIVFFTIAVTLILFLVFPGRLLFSITLQQDEPDPIALFYLNKLNAKYPDDINLRSAYIHQQINLGKLQVANDNIITLAKNPAAKNLVEALKYDYLVFQFDQLKKHKKETTEKMLALNQQLNTVLKLELPKERWLTLANMSLRYDLPEHALAYYLKMDELSPHQNIDWDLRVAALAMQSSHYKVAADYYMKAADAEPAITVKRFYVKEALTALQGGKMGDEGLAIAAKLPPKILNDVDFLFFLSEYALSVNQPQVAAEYVQKAMSLQGESQ